jgi:VIT1/CCC1 family predicted Fe2+/Mn2+ transporter
VTPAYFGDEEMTSILPIVIFIAAMFVLNIIQFGRPD